MDGRPGGVMKKKNLAFNKSIAKHYEKRYRVKTALEKDAKHRRILQNLQLINHDFPWLWAIRNPWNPALDEIKVLGGDANIIAKLRQAHTSANQSEVWVQYWLEEKNGVMMIEHGEIPLAALIMRAIPPTAQVMYIAMVRRSLPMVTIDIYRNGADTDLLAKAM